MLAGNPTILIITMTKTTTATMMTMTMIMMMMMKMIMMVMMGLFTLPPTILRPSRVADEVVNESCLGWILSISTSQKVFVLQQSNRVLFNVSSVSHLDGEADELRLVCQVKGTKYRVAS